MASLLKLHKVIKPLASGNTGIICNIVRTKYINPYDWAPGPYPKTEEECRAAAKKYNLSPEEYKPLPDDGHGFGDYPDLDTPGRAVRDPWYPWDDPAHRRNFNEPMHYAENIRGEDRWDAGQHYPVSDRFATWSFLGVMGLFAGLILLAEPFASHHPVMPKQYPTAGVAHYTFEPAR